MNYNKKTVKDIDIKGKRSCCAVISMCRWRRTEAALSPMTSASGAALPTIQYLLDQGAGGDCLLPHG